MGLPDNTDPRWDSAYDRPEDDDAHRIPGGSVNFVQEGPDRVSVLGANEGEWIDWEGTVLNLGH